MPTRNRLEWIGESLQSLLTQTIKEIEIIVIDDASDDGTKEFLDEWAASFPVVKVIHNEKQMGGGVSRNIGMKAATAPIIAICDDDDINADQRAEIILKHFEVNPNSELVNFPYRAIGYFNETIEDFGGEPFNYEQYKKSNKFNYFCNPSVGVKAASLREVGGYEKENEKETDDAQFVKKWIDAGKKIDFQPGLIPIFHRNLPDSMMVQHRGWKKEWVQK
jgi:glycosyltransferase involved in cell wall biosynthesis